MHANPFWKTISPAVGELHRFAADMKLRGHLALLLGKGLQWQMSLFHGPLTLFLHNSRCCYIRFRLLACRSAPFVSGAHPPLSHRAHLKSPHHDEGAEATGFPPPKLRKGPLTHAIQRGIVNPKGTYIVTIIFLTTQRF